MSDVFLGAGTLGVDTCCSTVAQTVVVLMCYFVRFVVADVAALLLAFGDRAGIVPEQDFFVFINQINKEALFCLAKKPPPIM